MDPTNLSRGSVWQVRLDPVEGFEQGGTRPVVVVSNDVLNSALPVVTVAVMTTRKTERVFATEVLVHPPDGGVVRPSKILLYQLRTISKSRLMTYMGRLPGRVMARLDAALRLTLEL